MSRRPLMFFLRWFWMDLVGAQLQALSYHQTALLHKSQDTYVPKSHFSYIWVFKSTSYCICPKKFLARHLEIVFVSSIELQSHSPHKMITDCPLIQFKKVKNWLFSKCTHNRSQVVSWYRKRTCPGWFFLTGKGSWTEGRYTAWSILPRRKH